MLRIFSNAGRSGSTIDVSREMMRLTLWIVGKTLFDADVLGEAEELGHALETTLRSFNNQLSAFVPLPPTWPTPGNRRTHARDRASGSDGLSHHP